ncbi:MAG: hypothetical protein AUK63_2590 [bacterium P3]|nr:MAG: hypothetical protein AUK63_2590 [bacterium P3]KWW26763.1 MAG: hypothetical protein AUK64_2444 [bacterium P201]
MEVITIESKAYQNVMERLDIIEAFIRQSSVRHPQEQTDRWVSSTEAAEILGVSQRTLQRMRSRNDIAYSLVGNSCRYRLAEIRRVIESNQVPTEQHTLDQISHTYRVRTGNNKKSE